MKQKELLAGKVAIVTGGSTIFDHRDPACVKMICEAQFDY